jgi:hypothetical protein
MTDETKAVALPAEVVNDRRSGLVPQTTATKATLVEVDQPVVDLGTAVAQLGAVVKQMGPVDDLIFEVSQERSSMHLRLRAYKRNP